MKPIIMLMSALVLCGCDFPSAFLITEKIDGHSFIVNKNGGILHHPDCPCGKKEVLK